jgi:undecaprenyl-phosphate galactose phosphotransferase
MAPEPRFAATAAKPCGNRYGFLLPVILIGIDYVMVVLSALTVYFLRNSVLPRYFPQLPMAADFSLSATYIYVALPVTYILLLSYEGLYFRRQTLSQSMESLFKVSCYASALMVLLLYFMRPAGVVSRLFFGIHWLVSFAFLLVGRYVTKRIMMRTRIWEKPVVIVGAGKTAELLAKSFVDDPGRGYKIVGVVADQSPDRALIGQYPHLGLFADAEQAILQSEVQDVIVAEPGLDREALISLIYRIQPLVRRLTIVPDLFGMSLTNVEVDTIYKDRTVMLSIRNNLAVRRNFTLKRLFDLVAGIPILLLGLPLMAGLAVLIKLDSPGPVLFADRRLGRKEKEFVCYKFRTMQVDGDRLLSGYFARHPEAALEWETYAKLRDYDPRVTRVGKVLRRYSLDELPQLFNVLRGDMSLVGPRPYLPRERERMGYLAHTIFEALPGMTGFWQVTGRNDVEFDGRLQMDSWYVRNWSFWQDIVILLQTAQAVLRRKGAY